VGICGTSGSLRRTGLVAAFLIIKLKPLLPSSCALAQALFTSIICWSQSRCHS
jgi:hypothetical protein